jgi:hypothetical protein
MKKQNKKIYQSTIVFVENSQAQTKQVHITTVEIPGRVVGGQRGAGS